MASSYTDIGTELMTTGENAGNWGTKTNTNLQILEEALRGYVAQSIAGGTQTTALTYTDGTVGDAARNMIIALTGTITGNQTITVPAVEKMWIIDNQTSGAYTVNIKVSGQTGVTWGASDKGTKILYGNGTDVVDTDIGGVGAYDLNGATLTLDADGDTDITADTDDQIDIRIAGADDFQFTANTFTAQAGSTIAAQALTATTVTASGIIKTDSTTAATSTTDGSLQTDGGLSVAADAIIGDDLKLLSDSAVLSFGADSDTTLTHTDGTGLTLNSTNKLLFRDTGLYINSSTDGQLDIVADTEVQIAATTIDINGAIAMDGAITGATNITLSGELDAATLDISGNADIDGTLEADAITINGTAIGSIYGAVAGSSSIVTTGALDSGSITSGFGTIDTGSSAITTTGLISGGSLDIDNVLINGTTIGHTDDTDLLTVADGLLTVAGEISVTTLDIGGTNVTTTAAEINLIDGGTARGTTAVADADGILHNDAGTMRMTSAATFKTYFTSGVSSAADDLTVGDDAVNLTTSSGNITIDAAANNTDIIFKGTDATADITMLTLDGSEAGLAIFNDSITVGDNLNLTTDSSVINFGADSDTTLTHTDGTGLTLNSTNKLCFQDTGTFINSNADGDLDLSSDGTAADSIKLTSAGGVTLAANNTGSTGVIDLKAEYLGIIKFYDGTNQYGYIYDGGAGNINLQVAQNNGDFILGGQDDGSGITALTVDMSEAGLAIFNDSITVGDNLNLTTDSTVINFGADSDTTLTHTDGTGLTLNSTNKLCFQDTGTFINSNADGDLDLSSDGTAADSILATSAGGITLDANATGSTGVITLDAQYAGEILLKDGGTTYGDLYTSSNDFYIKSAISDGDIILRGNDGGSSISALVLDMSAAGAATFNDKVIATELDISGNMDIDGTSNLDAVDIDGAVQLDATLTIGANDQGYDVILYGDTASANVTWDTSADDLIFNGGAGLIVPDGQFTLGSTAVAATAAELNKMDGGTSATSTTVADADRVVLNDNGTMVQVAMTDIKTYIGGGTSWQAVKTGNFTAAAGQGVFANTTSSAFTVTLPAGSIGDEVSIIDYAGTFDSNNLTVAANGSEKIHASTDDLTVATERAGFTLVFTDSTQGWLLKDK